MTIMLTLSSTNPWAKYLSNYKNAAGKQLLSG